jgi:hypothetical protein
MPPAARASSRSFSDATRAAPTRISCARVGCEARRATSTRTRRQLEKLSAEEVRVAVDAKGAERLVEGVVGTSIGFGVSAFVVSVVFVGFDPANLAVGAVGLVRGLPAIAAGSAVRKASYGGEVVLPRELEYLLGVHPIPPYGWCEWFVCAVA